MSKTSKRSENRPFKLQFGTGAPPPDEKEPKLAPSSTEVDDEFVFHNSAQIMRELGAKRAPAPQPIEPTAPQAEATLTTDAEPDPDEPVVDNILDPNWEPPEEKPRVARNSAEPRQTSVAGPVSPLPVPPMPQPKQMDAVVSEFGYVLPEDETGKNGRGWAAYAGLAAGLVLAVGALGGAWVQMRPDVQDTTIAGDLSQDLPDVSADGTAPVVTAEPDAADTPVDTMDVAAVSDPAEDRPNSVAPIGRVTPSPPSLPEPETIGHPPERLPQRDSTVALAGDPDPAPGQPIPESVASIPETAATPNVSVPAETSPGPMTVAGLKQPADDEASDGVAEDTPADPQTIPTFSPDAEADGPMLQSPLPKRATERPRLVAPTLPEAVAAGPRVDTTWAFALREPDKRGDPAPSIRSIVDQGPTRFDLARAPSPGRDDATGPGIPQPTLGLPSTQTRIAMSEGSIIATPAWELGQVAQDVAPQRPDEPEGPSRAALSTPVLLAASAQLLGQSRNGGTGAKGTSYATVDLPAPVPPTFLLALGANLTTTRINVDPTAPPELPTDAPDLAKATPQPRQPEPYSGVNTAADVQIASAELIEPGEETAPSLPGPTGRVPVTASAPDPLAQSPATRGAFEPGDTTTAALALVETGAIIAPSESNLSFDPVANLTPVPRDGSGQRLANRPAASERPTPQTRATGAPVQVNTVDAWPSPAPDMLPEMPGTAPSYAFLTGPVARPDIPTAGTPPAVAAAFRGVRVGAFFGASDLAPVALDFGGSSPARPARLLRGQPDTTPTQPAKSAADALPGTVDTHVTATGPSQIVISGQPAVPLPSRPATMARVGAAPKPVTSTPERIASVAPIGQQRQVANTPAPSPLMFLAPESDPEKTAPVASGPKLSSFARSAEWMGDFPGELSDIGGAVTIISAERGSPEWVRPGSVIRTVDGVAINDLEAWTNMISAADAASSGVGRQIELQITFSDGNTTRANLDLPMARTIVLNDGTVIETHRHRGKWKAKVKELAEGTGTDLKVGDTLLFDFVTRQKVNTPQAFEVLLTELEAQDTRAVTFAIVRDGALENATLVLEASR